MLRDGVHQQDWYKKLNRRAVVPTLIDGDKVIPESNVILEYLEDTYPEPRLSPKDSFGKAQMRLWTKQLDEDIHDASAAIISFGIAFRHQYLERGELGRAMLDQIPNLFKRERRRDVIEKGPDSMHFVIAVQRMVQLLDEMEEALAGHPWLVGDEYTLADVAFTPYLLRLEHLDLLGMVARAPARRGLVRPLPGAAELCRSAAQMGEREVSHVDEIARRAALAAGPRHHGCGLKARLWEEAAC